MNTPSPSRSLRHKEIFAVELVIDGVRYIETEWPADGLYEITSQITHPVNRPGEAGYMGLFTRNAAASESGLQWTACSERMPSEKGNYIVADEHGRVVNAWIESHPVSGKMDFNWPCVTHWMPYPEAPK